MEKVHTEVIDGITYTVFIEQDTTPVRGNALASGDDSADREAENAILKRLDSGDTWAWASVQVEATVTLDGASYSGEDWLGGCSYADTANFVQPDGYYSDMKDTARENLLDALRSARRQALNCVPLIDAFLVEVPS